MKLTIHRDESDRNIFHVYRYCESAHCVYFLFSVTKDLLFELLPTQKAQDILNGMAYDDGATVRVTLELLCDAED